MKTSSQQKTAGENAENKMNGSQLQTGQDAGDYSSQSAEVAKQNSETRQTGEVGTDEFGDKLDSANFDDKQYTLKDQVKLAGIAFMNLASKDKSAARAFLRYAEEAVAEEAAEGDVSGQPPAEATAEPEPAPEAAAAAPAPSVDPGAAKLEQNIRGKQQQVEIDKAVVDGLQDILKEVQGKRKLANNDALRQAIIDTVAPSTAELYADKVAAGDKEATNNLIQVLGDSISTAIDDAEAAKYQKLLDMLPSDGSKEASVKVADSAAPIETGTDKTKVSPATKALSDEKLPHVTAIKKIANLSNDEKSKVIATLDGSVNAYKNLASAYEALAKTSVSKATLNKMAESVRSARQAVRASSDAVLAALKADGGNNIVRGKLMESVNISSLQTKQASHQIAMMNVLGNEATVHTTRQAQLAPAFKLAAKQVQLNQIDLSELPAKVADYVKMPTSAFKVVEQTVIDLAARSARVGGPRTRVARVDASEAADPLDSVFDD